MSEHDELSRKLLEENGLSGPLGRDDREDLRAIIEAERRRTVEVNKIVSTLWIAFLGLIVLSWIAMAGRGSVPFVIVVLASITFIVALTSTLRLALRMGFRPRRVEERLERIEAQLARIEAAQTGSHERETGSEQ